MSLTAINVWPGIPARHAPHASSQHSGWVELSMASGGMKAKRSLGRPRERCSGSEAVRLRRGAFAVKRFVHARGPLQAAERLVSMNGAAGAVVGVDGKSPAEMGQGWLY
jgi:hypothetical protein